MRLRPLAKLALYALGASVVLVADASACRRSVPPAERIARSNYDAVAIGVVRNAAPVPSKFGQPWRGTADLTRYVVGSGGLQHVAFGRSGEPTACDDGTPVPASGDPWVFYFGMRGGAETLLLSYPLSVARGADPTLSDVSAAGRKR